MFPSKPTFTEKDLPDLKGKVYMVTGSSAGIGKELARILYAKNAKVWVAARSESKATKAIEEIKASAPSSAGELVFLPLDLADLTTIKPSVERFLAAESTLHVLFNNAGVMMPNDTAGMTAQGYELHLGVNNVGTFLLTALLTPLLVATAKKSPANTVRVVWVSSSGAEMFAEEGVAISEETLRDFATVKANRYGLSKAGNWLHAVEFAKRHRADGIVSIPLNPGNLRSELFRDSGVGLKFLARTVGYPVVNGAYTELFAGLSPDVTLDNSGEWGEYRLLC